MMVFVISAYATRAIDVPRPGFVQIQTVQHSHMYEGMCMDMSNAQGSSGELSIVSA